ncbi:fluoride efflux transporter CrcB [Paenibacillus peoriae]|uniref:fluoride efflux transporter CrcB n=1 Tax=Paenibacillus peoriae TaxID=59893 RepID=UPI003F958987
MKDVLFVAAGGALGTSTRYGLQSLLPAAGADFPLGVLLINWIGCLFLGWFFTVTLRSWRIKPRLRLVIGTGFTGGFTTFSTFGYESLQLMERKEYRRMAMYVLSSVVVGVVAAAIGYRVS